MLQVELKLFLITRQDDDYGKTFQMLVAASGETEARKLAGRYEREHGGKEPFDWVDDEISAADHIGQATQGTEPGVVMTKESAG